MENSEAAVNYKLWSVYISLFCAFKLLKHTHINVHGVLQWS